MISHTNIQPLAYHPTVSDYYRPEWVEDLLAAVECISFEEHAVTFYLEAMYAQMKAEDDRN